MPEAGTRTAGKMPILSARGVGKSFGAVTALEDVDIDLNAGEVVALLGDNGAGKSTLVSLLSGVQPPSAGALFMDGEQIRLTSPLHARELGIVTVFQDLALIDERDVAFNIFAGVELCRMGFVLDHRRMYAEAERVLRELKVNIPDVRAIVRSMSGGQRQAIAIARTVARGARVMIMDEPTAALGVRESRKVYDLVRSLRESGKSVLIISHDIRSVFGIADRAVILRLGRKVADIGIDETDMETVVGYVVGTRGDDA